MTYLTTATSYYTKATEASINAFSAASSTLKSGQATACKAFDYAKNHKEQTTAVALAAMATLGAGIALYAMYEDFSFFSNTEHRYIPSKRRQALGELVRSLPAHTPNATISTN